MDARTTLFFRGKNFVPNNQINFVSALPTANSVEQIRIMSAPILN